MHMHNYNVTMSSPCPCRSYSISKDDLTFFLNLFNVTYRGNIKQIRKKVNEAVVGFFILEKDPSVGF